MHLKTVGLVTLIMINFLASANAAIKPQHKVQQKVPVEAKVYSEDKLNIVVDSKAPEFSLELKSNPTTGFTWFIREYDANLITPVKHSFKQPEKQLMGAPGLEVFTFKLKPLAFTVPMQTVVRMTYARAWEGSENATQLAFHIATKADK